MKVHRAATEITGRILIAALFLFSGVAKALAYGGTAEYMEAFGLPGELLPLVIVLELAAGVALIAGWYPRATAWTLAAFCVASGLLFHFDLGNEAERINLLKNLAIAGALACIAVREPRPAATLQSA